MAPNYLGQGSIRQSNCSFPAAERAANLYKHFLGGSGGIGGQIAVKD